METETQKYDLSAGQSAALNQVKPQSVRARLCRTGLLDRSTEVDDWPPRLPKCVQVAK